MADVGTPFDKGLYEPLTEREQEILLLLAEGLPNRQIGERLFIAYTTVKWYNKQIFNKLGADNRADAIKQARALGLLTNVASDNAPRHSLPAQVTPFVARDREMGQLAWLLRDANTRFITMLAPGGMGKTRLALAVGGMVLPNFPDGVYFVPLAPLTSPEHIVPTIAESTSFQFLPDSRTPKQQLFDYFREKTLLLILDNFEHRLDGASLVSDLLHAAPAVKVLATSRERLNLSGETVYTLGGMAYPEQAGEEGALDYGAVQLFAQCARRAQPQFVPKGESIVPVCQLVHGMPLAIELAAAWAGALSPDEIADEITRSLDFLRTSMRDVPKRLSSVRAVFESSWGRLTEDEQSVFGRLSVFRGGCTREAAQAITGADINTLTGFVGKALIWRNPESGRYEVHELLRQYAEQALEEMGQADAARDAHSAYYAEFMHQRESDLKGWRQIEAADEIGRDRENVKAGFLRAVERGQYSAALPYTHLLHRLLDTDAHIHETAKMFASVAEALSNLVDDDAQALLGHLLVQRGAYLLGLDLYVPAKRELQRALEVARDRNDRALIVWSLIGLVWSLSNLGLEDEARRLSSESVTMARELGDTYLLAYALHYLASAICYPNHLEEMRCLIEEALALRREIGDTRGQIGLLNDLGVAAYSAGLYEEAEQYSRESYAVARGLGNRREMEVPIATLEALAFHRGKLGEVEARIEEGLALAEALNHRVFIGRFLTDRSILRAVQGRYVEAKALAEEALQVAPSSESGNWDKFALMLSLGFALCGLGDFRAAGAVFHEMFLPAKETRQWMLAGLFPFYLTGFAAIFAHGGQPERAVGLLSLLANHPRAPKWWFEREPLTLRLVSELQQLLSPEAFAAAWERGLSLDVDAVIAHLLGETKQRIWSLTMLSVTDG